MKQQHTKAQQTAILVGLIAMLILIGFGTWFSQSATKGTILPSQDPVGYEVHARTIVELVKKKEGKVSYLTYSNKPLVPNEPDLFHIHAKIRTVKGKEFTISYMEDRRPKSAKDYMGNILRIEDKQTGEAFSDLDANGIVAFPVKETLKEQNAWPAKYSAVLKELYDSMMFQSP